MTAKELYATEPEFRAFVLTWVRRRQCPLPFADWLTEHGQEAMADCALWAATEAFLPAAFGPWKAPVFPRDIGLIYSDPAERRKMPGRYAWFRIDVKNGYVRNESDDLPMDRVPEIRLTHGRPRDAILALLDAWQPLPQESPTGVKP